MRVFATQAMWDKVEEKWYEVYAVDGETVEQEEYFRELEVEQCLENDDSEDEESYCKCCSCDAEDCPDFNCTCDEDSEEEFDEEEYEPCQCNDCRTQRHEDTINESVSKAFDKIMESERCPDCIIDALMEFSLEMKRLGWSDHRDYINECNG